MNARTGTWRKTRVVLKGVFLVSLASYCVAALAVYGTVRSARRKRAVTGEP
jgi:hypothetical protein